MKTLLVVSAALFVAAAVAGVRSGSAGQDVRKATVCHKTSSAKKPYTRVVAILVTGRYPETIFDFTLGVLRWSWRVGYYATGAFGTDRYPPFSLGAEPDYPATLDIGYPEHLSRGLALVKWWLLAIPHYLVLAFLLGGGGYLATRSDAGLGGGLIGLLVLIAVVILLFTGSYPKGLFDLVLGLDRWVLRVAAYVALMTDSYPPFRLDLGGTDPSAIVVGEPPSGEAAPPAPVTSADPERTRWSAGRAVALVVGSVLVLGGLGALGGATALLSAETQGRDAAGFVTTPAQRFTGEGYALVADPLRLHQAAGGPDLAGVIGQVRIRATGTAPSGVFVGIGPSTAVQTYLAPVAHSALTPPPSRTQPSTPAQPTAGGPPATLPGEASFWVAQAAGTGPQELVWTPAAGDWTVVVMNADGSRPVVADLSVGATAPGLGAVGTALFASGAAALLVGSLVVALALWSASGRSRR
jgi:hypothetical protein